METRHFEAISARSMCAAGQFILCGKKLVPFSFRHTLQLEALGCRLWAGEEETELADFVLAAHICSQSDFSQSTPPSPTPEEIASFDVEDALAVWAEYVRVCYGTRPRLWKLRDSQSSHCRAPLEEYIVTFIQRHAHGYTRKSLYTMPAAEVLWIFETLGEQLSTRSRILTEEDEAEMERQSTPEAVKAQGQKLKKAGQIMAYMKKVGTEEQMIKLLNLLEEGKLPSDWRKKVKHRKGARRG